MQIPLPINIAVEEPSTPRWFQDDKEIYVKGVEFYLMLKDANRHNAVEVKMSRDGVRKLGITPGSWELAADKGDWATFVATVHPGIARVIMVRPS